MGGTRRGRLIALEGIDGCGKSTQAALVAEHTGALLTFEPGATGLGSTLRKLLLDPDGGPVSERAEALLVAADRAQHVDEVIAPTLESGRWVVTDRFSASTLAYQGYGRGLDRSALDRLVAWATGGLRPDATVLVDVPLEVAAARRLGTAEDRLEAGGDGFQQRVVDGYRALAAGDPRWAVVDGTGSVEEVARAVRTALGDLLGSEVDGGS